MVTPSELYPSSSCKLSPGAIEGTVSGAKSPYSGFINLYDGSTCTPVGNETVTFTISGSTLTTSIGETWTKVT